MSKQAINFTGGVGSEAEIRLRAIKLDMEMVSKGYMLLSPDVHFNTGATGDDMLECVEAAVDQAVELGYADPDRVGLCGHSFSGYGAAYT